MRSLVLDLLLLTVVARLAAPLPPPPPMRSLVFDLLLLTVVARLAAPLPPPPPMRSLVFDLLLLTVVAWAACPFFFVLAKATWLCSRPYASAPVAAAAKMMAPASKTPILRIDMDFLPGDTAAQATGAHGALLQVNMV